MSTEVKKEVTKESVHAKKLKNTKDGRIIVSDLEMLKEYFEISLIIVDFEDDLQEEALQKEPAKKSVKIKDPADQEDAKETVKKLTTALDYQQRGAPPHLSRPPSPGLPDARARYTPLECFYCGGKHGVNTCDFFGPDLQERRVLRYQGMYHYPNRQPIVVESGMSVGEMVQRYHEEQENLSGAKDPAPEPTAAIAALDEWGSWVPRQANIDEDNLQTNIGFGLTKLQRIQEKNPPSGSQTNPSKTQEPVSKTPPPNQEALKNTTRKSFPGSWMEEDTVEEEASIGRSTKDSVPPLEKGKQASQTPTGTKEDAGGRLDKSIRHKFYKQTYTLTLEEIVKITSQFLKGLQESLLNEEGPGKGANSGKLNCSAGFEEPDSDEEAGITYDCLVGMMSVYRERSGMWVWSMGPGHPRSSARTARSAENIRELSGAQSNRLKSRTSCSTAELLAAKPTP
ncbi:hypothetical protein Pst134EA_019217 [Puccinia striiformis f. sp. tritici]|uniref:hypothetical protein n=1 Tax=Puccinia striiformis f. sp. tritici TaxID=168172 RepID=UPI002007900B|nr:hypothetical protein Pst134EA_019217 [Puccinia striiformis f. sp. tritici]KAH9459066.1 hypothetical protein Pst134EA_019217 [Puccinia striiformis f. sp. tritici]